MNYARIRFSHLLHFMELLEEVLLEEEDVEVRTHLKALSSEVGLRRFSLYGVWEGRIVKEYGRWRSEQECMEQAAAMGLPVGHEFRFGSRSFRTVARERAGGGSYPV